MINVWHSIDDYSFMDYDHLLKEVEKILDKRFILVKNEFEQRIKECKYRLITIDKYNLVYIIESRAI